MELSKTIGMMAIVVAGAAMILTQAALGRYRPFADIGTVWVNSNMCTGELESQLNDSGFAVTSSPRAADAILEVNLHPVPDHVGHSYTYTATLRDADGRILLSQSDQETSLIRSRVCPSISDNVVEQIESRFG